MTSLRGRIFAGSLLGARSSLQGPEAILYFSLVSAGVYSLLRTTGYLRAMMFWISIEIAFYVYQSWRYHAISCKRVEDAAIPRDRALIVQQRLLTMGELINIKEFFESWFQGAEFSTIKQGNVEEFIAYGFFCDHFVNLADQDQEMIRAYLKKIEEKFDIQFEPGHNEELEFMAHLWEPLRTIHKPLAVHLACEAMCLATDAILYGIGFQAYRTKDGYRYWVFQPGAKRKTSTYTYSPLNSPSPPRHRRRSSTGRTQQLQMWDSVSSLTYAEDEQSQVAADTSPILFIHGVGLGVTPYIQFVHELMKAFPTRPVILLEARHVSICLSWRAVSTCDMADACAEILERHGWKQAAFMAHSYGTFVVTRVSHMHRHLVQSMVLVDPVCMLTIYPQLLQNFVYKPPQLAKLGSVLGAVDSARYLFCRDLTVADAFCRKFLWHRECLWIEEIPEHSLLVLAAADDLVPSALVCATIKHLNSSCQTMLHPVHGHGGFLLDTPWRKQMMARITEVVNAGATTAAKKCC